MPSLQLRTGSDHCNGSALLCEVALMILLELFYVIFTSFTLTGNQTLKISWYLVEPNELMQTPQVLWILMKSVFRQQK